MFIIIICVVISEVEVVRSSINPFNPEDAWRHIFGVF